MNPSSFPHERKRLAACEADASSPQHREPTPSISFLSLPQELRDEIYTYAFKNKSIGSIRFQDSILKTCGKDTYWYPNSAAGWWPSHAPLSGRFSGFPAWMFISKRVLTEAIKHFACGQIFHIRTSFASNLSKHTPRHIEHYINLVFVNSIRAVHFTSLCGPVEGESNTTVFPRYLETGLPALIALRGTNAPLLRLELAWMWNFYDHGCRPLTHATLESQALHDLKGCFSSVTIEISIRAFDERNSRSIEEQLHPHAEDWARRLVGPESATTKIGCTWRNEILYRCNWVHRTCGKVQVFATRSEM